MKKSKNYNTEDFLKDDYFLKWVCDPDEEAMAFWENYLLNNPDKKDAIARARKTIYTLGNKGNKISKEEYDQMRKDLRERLNSGKTHGGKHNPLLKIAIGFFGVLAIAFGIFKSGIFDKNSPEVNTPQITLELQDGSIEVVDENTSKIITTEKGQKVVSQEKNILVYNEGAETTTEDLVYNQLTVPYGKKFELVLSDGSHVFLNAGSKLRYPVKFLPGQPRDVFLDGEAFFKVEKDEARPFTVVTEEMNTRVYGTKFNVTSYKNENNTYTVLVEGSVGVYNANDDSDENPLTIVPGQRAVYEDGNIAVEEIEVQKYTAWTKNELYFINDRFDLILRKLERQFNVSIENKYAELNQEQFTGTFRQESLEEILSICQKHTPFDYVREGSKITITPE